jgi:hypothetical protein
MPLTAGNINLENIRPTLDTSKDKILKKNWARDETMMAP